MADDPFASLKAVQKESWGLFAPLEAITTIPAAALVKWSQIKSGDHVLDVGCGTGVVAITAARTGAKVEAMDLSPRLLERARANARISGLAPAFSEGDVEALAFPDASFNVVVSQFGHMFAPRPEVAIREMLRVLKPGGTIAFSTWPPGEFVGRMFALVSRHHPPPPGAAPPPQWGDQRVVRERLGDAVTGLEFEHETMLFPCLSPAHYRESMEVTLGPVVKLVEKAGCDAEKLRPFRTEFEALVAEYFENNTVHQQFLMTRAIRR